MTTDFRGISVNYCLDNHNNKWWARIIINFVDLCANHPLLTNKLYDCGPFIAFNAETAININLIILNAIWQS